MADPRKTAKKIVKGILDDMTDRRGLRHEWDQIDDDIQTEIRKAWEVIALTAIAEDR